MTSAGPPARSAMLVQDASRPSPAEGSTTHEVHGGVYKRYAKVNGPKGTLGLPTSDEVAGAAPGTWMNSFQNGYVIWSRDHGGWEITGDFAAAYRAVGDYQDDLGAPTGVATKDGTVTKQNFAGGRIYSSTQGTYAVWGG